jgi:hypothetical protein
MPYGAANIRRMAKGVIIEAKARTESDHVNSIGCPTIVGMLEMHWSKPPLPTETRRSLEILDPCCKLDTKERLLHDPNNSCSVPKKITQFPKELRSTRNNNIGRAGNNIVKD